MKKVLFIGGIGVLVFVLFSFAVQIINKKTAEPPDIKTAPYVITTVSRVYYAASYNITADNTTVIKDWWEKDGNGWTKHKDPIELDKAIFGKVTAKRRVE